GRAYPDAGHETDSSDAGLGGFLERSLSAHQIRIAAEISKTFMAINNSTDAISQLCPNCGLCCNGVLFADVELQKGDNAGRLIDLGMSLKKKGMKRAFTQPCQCFDGKLCKIYNDRPKRCATFECGLLKRVQSGAMPVPAA